MKLRTVLVVLAWLLLGGWGGFRLGQNSAPVVYRTAGDQADMSLFWQVWEKLEASYLIKADLQPEAMVYGAIKGMTAALGDPYTVFLPPPENQESKDELDGAFEGVGIQLGFKDQTLAVIAPLSGTPAAEAGVKAGDLILHLKDEAKALDRDSNGLSLPEAVRLIRGPKGSIIELTLLREGETEPQTVKIRRDTIVVKSVELVWLGRNQDIAQIRLTRFGGRTEAEWQAAVNEIVSRRPRGIILDLRNNPGGYLQGAVALAGEFLPLGKLVVKQEDAAGRIETYSVDRQGRLTSQPLLVLINQGSASSSEILAGALKDHGRAKLIGENSFGKGTVQEALDLGKGAGLHVTTAKWLLPGGIWVNETKGLTPDVAVADDPDTEADEPLERAVELL
jgi:carboxyl-terminal processing protease